MLELFEKLYIPVLKALFVDLQDQFVYSTNERFITFQVLRVLDILFDEFLKSCIISGNVSVDRIVYLSARDMSRTIVNSQHVVSSASDQTAKKASNKSDFYQLAKTRCVRSRTRGALKKGERFQEKKYFGKPQKKNAAKATLFANSDSEFEVRSLEAIFFEAMRFVFDGLLTPKGKTQLHVLVKKKIT